MNKHQKFLLLYVMILLVSIEEIDLFASYISFLITGSFVRKQHDQNAVQRSAGN